MKAHRIMLMGGTALALSALFSAMAQEQRATMSNLLDGDIIVTAQRRAESLNDVGMAVQAVDAGTLEALRVTDVRDLTAVAPSFTVSQSYQGVPTYTLRGIGFNTINLSATSTVGTYVDEVAYAYPIMNTGPMYDLERVEVLKGPQGTLYGRNTTAGLINFITGKPTDVLSGGMKAEFGNYKTYNFEAHLSGPLAEGVAARIAVRSENSDKGWQVSNSRPNERQGEVDKLGVRASLAIDPSPSTSIDVSLTYWQNKSDTIAGQGIGFTPATNPTTGRNGAYNVPGVAGYIAAHVPTRASQADWAPRAGRSADVGVGAGLAGDLAEDNRFWGLKLRWDQDVSDAITFVSLTSYNDFKRDALTDWSGAPYEIMLQNPNGRIKSFAQEIHFEGETGAVNWLVGAYYAHDKIKDQNRTLLGDNANTRLIRSGPYGPVPLSTLLNPSLSFNPLGYSAADIAVAFRTFEDAGRMESTTWSLFANADTELAEKLKLTLGVRYTQDKQDYEGCTRDFNGSMLANVNLVNRFLFTGGDVTKYPAALQKNQCNTYHESTNSFAPVINILDEDNLAWRVALDYALDDDILLYASVSRGFKSGQSPVNAASKARQNAAVRQEKLTAYEVGVKATLADRLLQANVSAFYYDYADKQISTYFADPIYTALARLDNVPKSKAYGVEGELTLRPAQGVTLSANGLWLKTEIIDYLGTNAAGLQQNFDGAEFIYSPRFQGSVVAAYDTPVSDRMNLNGAVSVRYQSRANTILEDDPLYKVDKYTVVNASVGLKTENGLSLALWSKNLFNKYYWSAVASNANVVVRFANMPRTFGATLGYEF